MTAVAQQTAQQVCVPHAWSLYFPEEEFAQDDRRAQLIQDLVAHWSRDDAARADLLNRTHFPQEGACAVTLAADALLQTRASADLEAALECQPLEALGCLAAAAYQVGLAEEAV